MRKFYFLNDHDDDYDGEEREKEKEMSNRIFFDVCWRQQYYFGSNVYR